MPEGLDLSRLEDHTILLIFSRLTQELRSRLSEEQVDAVSEPADALRLIAAATGELGGGLDQADRSGQIPQPVDAPAAMRRLLKLLAGDELLRPKIEALVERSPRRTPVPLDAAIAAGVIRDTVAAWLQTSVPIDYRESEHDLEFDLHLESSSVSASLVKDVAQAMLEIIRTAE